MMICRRSSTQVNLYVLLVDDTSLDASFFSLPVAGGGGGAPDIFWR
jgi:hypothetical protein